MPRIRKVLAGLNILALVITLFAPDEVANRAHRAALFDRAVFNMAHMNSYHVADSSHLTEADLDFLSDQIHLRSSFTSNDGTDAMCDSYDKIDGFSSEWGRGFWHMLSPRSLENIDTKLQDVTPTFVQIDGVNTYHMKVSGNDVPLPFSDHDSRIDFWITVDTTPTVKEIAFISPDNPNVLHNEVDNSIIFSNFNAIVDIQPSADDVPCPVD